MTGEPLRTDGVGDEGTEIDPYLWDGSGEPDPVVERLERSLAPALWTPGHMARAQATRAAAPRRRIGWRSGFALAAGLAIVAAGIWAVVPHQRVSNWNVETLAGKPGLGDGSVASISPLPAGEWLQTDANSRARLRGEGVGQVDVEPNSKLRLLWATKDEHRLELARGSISAFVTTPPKVFFVDTPAATAVDMGCAYKLNVDEAGEGVLYVTLGWVELHADGREVRVPAGAACRIGPKSGAHPGPGTPWFEDAEKAFVTSLERVDIGGGGLDEVLAGARVRDSLTLWHLAAILKGAERDRVLSRLAQLVPPPDGVTASAVDAAGLERWWGAVRASW